MIGTQPLPDKTGPNRGVARSNMIAGGILFLTVAFYLWFLSAWFFNVPRGDDQASILAFIESWRGAGTADRWSLLWEQYFGHRLVVTRLAAVGVDLFFGHLQLVSFHVLGLLLWLGIVAWCALRAAKTSSRIWAALPVVLLLVQPTGHTNITTAMQAPGNIGVLAMALAACCLAPGPGVGRFIAGLALSLLAICTSANGLLIAPVIALSLFINGRRDRALLTLATWAGCAVLYFRGFASSEVGAGAFSFAEFSANALAMLGTPYDLNRLPVGFSYVFGLFILGAAVAVSWPRRRVLAGDPAAVFAVFLLASVAMCAAGRIGWGAHYMGQDRYSPYGLLFAVCVWLCASPALRQSPRVVAAAIVATCTIATAAYAGGYATRQEEHRMVAAMIVNRSLGHSFVYNTWGQGAADQDRAYAEGVWRPAARVNGAPSADYVRSIATRPVTAGIGPEITLLPHRGRAFYLLQTKQPASSPPVFAVLVSESGAVLLPAVSERQTYLGMLQGKGLTKAGIERYIWSTSAPGPGSLRLLALALDSSGAWFVRWQSTITIHPGEP